MSRNFWAMFCLSVSLVMFTAAFADSAYASSGDVGESCSGRCSEKYDGTCMYLSDDDCSGTVNGVACACRTFTDVSTGDTSCRCGISNGNT